MCLPLAEKLIGFHLLIPFHHLQCDTSFMYTTRNGIVGRMLGSTGSGREIMAELVARPQMDPRCLFLQFSFLSYLHGRTVFAPSQFAELSWKTGKCRWGDQLSSKPALQTDKKNALLEKLGYSNLWMKDQRAFEHRLREHGCRCLRQLMLHHTNVQLPSSNDFYTSIVVNVLSWMPS